MVASCWQGVMELIHIRQLLQAVAIHRAHEKTHEGKLNWMVKPCETVSARRSGRVTVSKTGT